jgi:hypothetical protein
MKTVFVIPIGVNVSDETIADMRDITGILILRLDVLFTLLVKG